jgi:hypothetical protein
MVTRLMQPTILVSFQVFISLPSFLLPLYIPPSSTRLPDGGGRGYHQEALASVLIGIGYQLNSIVMSVDLSKGANRSIVSFPVEVDPRTHSVLGYKSVRTVSETVA